MVIHLQRWKRSACGRLVTDGMHTTYSRNEVTCQRCRETWFFTGRQLYSTPHR